MKFAIEINDLELIEGIYNRCLEYFKQDLNNNKEFLGIINTVMPLLNESYPEYITRYSSDTNMIIDSKYYKIENLKVSHLYPFFSNVEIVDLTPYKFWIRYSKGISALSRKPKPKPIITFMIPYIKLSSYQDPQEWWELIKPRPSPFVDTMNSEIYKTWNGEALINFKWETFGKKYYFAKWFIFTALLGCFTAAVTLSEDFLSKDIRDRLLIASVILGCIHLIYEIRQLGYYHNKWFYDPWNWFGKNK